MEPDDDGGGDDERPPPPPDDPGGGGRVGHGGLAERAAEIRSRTEENARALADALPTEAFSASARAAQERTAAAEAEVRRKRVAREIEGEVPVMDPGVRAKLRSLQQPVTLFGEGPYERRLRLRQFLADRIVFGGEPPPPPRQPAAAALPAVGAAAAAAPERFFTDGTAALREARVEVAVFSIGRARERVRRQQRELLRLRGLTRAERDAERSAAVEPFRDFVCTASQVGGARPLSAARVAPDGTCCLVASWDSVVRLYSLPSSEKVGSSFTGHDDRVTGVAWHPHARPDGGAAAARDPPGDPRAQQGGTGDPGDAGCSFATGAADKTVKLWNVGRRQCLTTLGGHTDRVNKVAFHPSGNFVGSTSYDRTWRLWDVTEGRQAYCVLEQEGHALATYGIDFHADGSLAATTDLSGVGRIWDLRHGRSIFTLEGHTKQVLGVAFSPEGWLLATGGDDHYVKLWDLRRRRVLATIAAHSGQISSLCFEPGRGRWLATASYDSTVCVWDAATARLVKQLKGHENKVMAVDAAPDGASLITCAFDRTWKLWSARDTGLTADGDVDALLLDKERSGVRAVEPPPPAAAAAAAGAAPAALAAPGACDGDGDEESEEGLQELE